MLMENCKQYTNNEVIRLVTKYLGEVLSPEEQEEFQAWIDADPENRALVERLQQEGKMAELYSVYKSFDTCRAWSRVHGKLFRRRNMIWRGVAAAVVVMGFLAYGLWVRQDRHLEVVVAEGVVLPGNGQVSLTFGSGRKVELNRTNSRMIQVDSNLKVKEDSGLVAYQHIAGLAGKEKHTLTVGRGAEYRLKLDDGTLVHLNADSKLIYPVSFGTNMREVILEGEAFFEVTKNSERPFVVHCPNYDVQVWGTSFNISVYPEEDFSHTTLVEGKVKVNDQDIVAGEQAVYSKNDGKTTVRQVEVEQYVAWQEGTFVFRNERLENVMKTLGRWYGVEFHFIDERAKEIRIGARFGRYDDMQPIVDMIKKTNLVEVLQTNRCLYISEKK